MITPKLRKDFFLAKIAGEAIDITTLIPPKAISTTEKILLAIADRFTAIDGKVENATTAKAGIVKKAANVSEAAGDAPTKAEFKALLDALIAAGIMEAPSNVG